MSDSVLMFSLAGVMLFLALVIPPIQNSISGTSTTYDVDGLETGLSETNHDLSIWTSIGPIESIFTMFFWAYTGLGVVFNSVLILFKVGFWWLVVKLIRGTG